MICLAIESIEELGREYGFDGHDEYTHGVGFSMFDMIQRVS